MEYEDIESLAEELHRHAGSELDDPLTPLAIARDLLGHENVREVDAQWLRQDGALCRVGTTWQIWVRRNLAPSRLAFAVAHETLEYALRRAGYEGEDVEHAANYGAAALIAPRRAFARAVRHVGEDLRELAETFVTTESMVALRWGEVTHQPLYLLSRNHHWTRGSEWGWPTSVKMRELVRASLPDGLRRIPLGDAPHRSLFLADSEPSI